MACFKKIHATGSFWRRTWGTTWYHSADVLGRVNAVHKGDAAFQGSRSRLNKVEAAQHIGRRPQQNRKKTRFNVFVRKEERGRAQTWPMAPAKVVDTLAAPLLKSTVGEMLTCGFCLPVSNSPRPSSWFAIDVKRSATAWSARCVHHTQTF